MDLFILLGGFTVLTLLGVPVAYALGLAAIFTALWIDLPLEAVMLKVSDGTDDFALLAIPFFILAGGIMAEGGMAERLVNLAKIFVGFIRGGLALVNILASTFFGAISGSSVADTASIGSVMIPQMVKNGYPRLFAVNVTISGSLQPLLIPPSHNAVIYSLAAGGTVSVAHLFIAGVIPGLLLGFSLMALCLIIAHRKNFPKGEAIPLRRALKIVVEAFWAVKIGTPEGRFVPAHFHPHDLATGFEAQHWGYRHELHGVYIRALDGRPFRLKSLRYRVTRNRELKDRSQSIEGFSNFNVNVLIGTRFDPRLSIRTQLTAFPVGPPLGNDPGLPFLTLPILGIDQVTQVFIASSASVDLDDIVLMAAPMSEADVPPAVPEPSAEAPPQE